MRLNNELLNSRNNRYYRDNKDNFPEGKRQIYNLWCHSSGLCATDRNQLWACFFSYPIHYSSGRVEQYTPPAHKQKQRYQDSDVYHTHDDIKGFFSLSCLDRFYILCKFSITNVTRKHNSECCFFALFTSYAYLKECLQSLFICNL